MRTGDWSCLWEMEENLCAGCQKDTFDFGTEVS